MENVNEKVISNIPIFMTGAGIQQYHRAEEGVVFAAQEGYTHWYIDGAKYHDRASKWSKHRIMNLLDLIKTYNVTPIYHGSFKNPLASDVPELRRGASDYLRQEIDIAAELSAPLIVHAGGIVEPRNVKNAKKRGLDGFIESLNDVLGYAKSAGVTLWLENLCNYQKFHPFYYIMTNIDEYRYVLNELPDVNMIFDVCHETVGGGDPIATFDELSDRICAFSFSDTPGDRDSHLQLGTGIVDFKSLIEKIMEKKWNGIISFETRGAKTSENFNFLNSIVEDIEMLKH